MKKNIHKSHSIERFKSELEHKWYKHLQTPYPLGFSDNICHEGKGFRCFFFFVFFFFFFVLFFVVVVFFFFGGGGVVLFFCFLGFFLLFFLFFFFFFFFFVFCSYRDQAKANENYPRRIKIATELEL